MLHSNVKVRLQQVGDFIKVCKTEQVQQGHLEELIHGAILQAFEAYAVAGSRLLQVYSMYTIDRCSTAGSSYEIEFREPVTTALVSISLNPSSWKARDCIQAGQEAVLLCKLLSQC